MELKTVTMEIPDEANIIIGQSHFIKTVEDLYEIMVTSVPQAKFGIAFCEASGPCLIRTEGNDETLKETAMRNAHTLAAGHCFVLVLKNAFPINVSNAIKQCSEVCSLYCATANPVEVIVAETEQGRGILGVIDGFKPKGIESAQDMDTRKDFLRKIGYKR
jgi:adenosine/AMP kinase